jgi:F-type H+-transporting ATPase subunit epsilon
VTYRSGRTEQHLLVAGGFAEVQPDRVIILAEVAEAPEEIDLARAERARQRAELRLSGRHPQGHEDEGEIDFDRALAALARALARIMVAGRVRTA